MNIEIETCGGRAVGYTMRLSAAETHAWANRRGHTWHNSRLSGDRLVVYVHSGGRMEFAVHYGREDSVSMDEIKAIVSDHLPPDCRHLWPVWERATVHATGA